MKKKAALALVVICALGLFACSGSSGKDLDKTDDIFSFNATVLEVNDNYLLVQPDDDSAERNSADKIEVSLKDKTSWPIPQVGDIVKVVHSGEILETYPARIAAVYRVEIISPKADPMNNDVVLTEPPVLTVIYGVKRVEALRGTTSWTYRNGDGTGTGIVSDSMHPLQAKEYMTPLYLIPTTVSSVDPLTAYLQWHVIPDKVVVRCWSEECWGQYDAESEDIPVDAVKMDVETGENSEPVNNYAIQLKDGNYIYEAVAEWNSSEAGSGTVYYSFYTVKPYMESHPIG